MLYFNRNLKKSIILTLSCLLLVSCHVFDDAKHALNYFCPKLKIGVNGVHEHSSKTFTLAVKSYVINYPDQYEKKVDEYFGTANGYAPIANAEVYSVNTDLDTYVDGNDNIVGKGFKSGRDTAIVAFNKTKQQILIIEYLKNPKAEKER